ncbi:LEPR-XLL domain-containing protein, partial [Ramlibacter sp.]
MRWLRRFRAARAERSTPVAEPMEPRLLFSADLGAGLLLG